MLGPLADNGGPARTHALVEGSSAIDAGSPDCPPPVTDQRGVARPQGVACDIGAFEFEGDDNGTTMTAEVGRFTAPDVALRSLSGRAHVLSDREYDSRALVNEG